MERVDNSGERRPVTPSEIAKFDQMEARFHALVAQFLEMQDRMKQAAADHDNQRLGDLTAQFEQMITKEWPDPNPDMINFMMHLLVMVDKARVWTEHTFDVAESALRVLATLQRPNHPIYKLPTFSQEELDQDVEAVLSALEQIDHGSTFITDTGVTLYNVHHESSCEAQFCVVHRPAPGPWDTWDTHWREDWRLMARICPHDVHHVAIEERLRMPLLGMLSDNHPGGCDCPCDLDRVEVIKDSEGTITGFRAKE